MLNQAMIARNNGLPLIYIVSGEAFFYLNKNKKKGSHMDKQEELKRKLKKQRAFRLKYHPATIRGEINNLTNLDAFEASKKILKEHRATLKLLSDM